MQAQVEADADGPLQARRRPDEVMARFKLQDKVDDDDKGDDVSSPKLKRCFLALDEDKVFKKQKHRPDEDKVDDDDKGDDVAVDQVAAVQSGLALAATLARNAVQVFRQQVETEGALVDAAKLQLALDLLHEPLLERPVQPLLSAQIAAQAYNIVRDVRKSCAPSCQELGKFAALAMRECLVLHICNSGSMSDIGFESALEHAFEKQLGPEFRSQLHLTRSAICRLGRSRTVFERTAPKIYSSTLNPEELQALFTVHHECALPQLAKTSLDPIRSVLDLMRS